MPLLVPLQAPYTGASSAGSAAAPENFLVGREIGRRYHFLVLSCAGILKQGAADECHRKIELALSLAETVVRRAGGAEFVAFLYYLDLGKTPTTGESEWRTHVRVCYGSLR